MEINFILRKNGGWVLLATIFFLTLVALSTAFLSYNFRIIKTTGGYHLVAKSDPAFNTPFVDITKWGIKELFVFRNITYEVINAGYGSEIPQVDMFNHAVGQGVRSIKEFDERYGVSQGVFDGYDRTVEQMRKMDREYEIKQKVDLAIDEAKRIDDEYGISDSVNEGMEKAGEVAKELWERVKDG